MKRREFEKQVAASVETARHHLVDHPDDGPARFVELLLTRFEVPDVPLDAEGQARVAGLLASIWRGLLESHYTGPEMLVFADALIAVVPDAHTLSDLAHCAGSFHGSWHSAAKNEVLAAERLARAALAVDSDDDSALWLYSCDDFLSRYNKARPKGTPKLRGAPVRDRGPEAWVKRVEDTLTRFDADEHPTELFMRMEVVPVETSEVVAALVHGLEHTVEWRGKKACAEALGRAAVDHDRARAALVAALRPPLPYDEWNMRGEAVYAEQAVSSQAAESIAHLGRHALAALPPLIDAIEAAPAFDVWDSRYYAETLLALTKLATGEARERAHRTLERLVARTHDLSAEERSFYGRKDFLDAARKLGVPG
jgi:hypothetical protein